MNPTGGKTPSSTRPSEYTTNALEQIRKDLCKYSHLNGVGSQIDGTSQPQQVSSPQNPSERDLVYQHLDTLLKSGYSLDAAVNAIKQGVGVGIAGFCGRPDNFLFSSPNQKQLATKLMRKPSIDRDLQPSNSASSFYRGSPVVDSGAGSSRSDSPHSHQQLTNSSSRASTGQYSPSPCPSTFSDAPPPPPPRCSSTPPTPPPVPQNLQQMFKRMSPAAAAVSSAVNSTNRPSLPISQSPARGTSPTSSTSSNNHVNGSLSNGTSPGGGGVSNGIVNRQPMIVQNGPQVQQQLSQQMQALSIYQSGGNSGEPPPPYPIIQPGAPPPSYTSSIQSRQSPTQSTITTTTTASVAGSDYRKSPSSGIYSATSTGSPSPITITQQQQQQQQQGNGSMARPIPLPAWGARQTKTQPPIIMQSVKSTQVQKPVLQTAIAPTAPTPVTNTSPQTASTCVSPVMLSQAPPSYALSIQQKSQQQQQLSSASPSPTHIMPNGILKSQTASKTPSPPPSSSPVPTGAPALPSKKSDLQSKPNVPTTEPPSYASTMQAILAQQQGSPSPQPQQPSPQQAQQPQNPPPRHHLPPPPPYSTNTNKNGEDARKLGNLTTTPPLPPQASSAASSQAANSQKGGDMENRLSVNKVGEGGASNNTGSSSKNEISLPLKKIKHQSPIPLRKKISKEKEAARKDIRIKHYSPQAYKFFMEQHVENVQKSYSQRVFRKNQLEKEMNKMGLPPATQAQMRLMLCQKESNYIRLKRAKMDKSMFVKLKHIGVGAFGEVSLVKKIDTTNHLYAMKTLRKADVLKRNQVAHVKAERDILAEADNEWVVRLYYSFQDEDNLYFVMDYIPGGDLMSLLIKKEIFEEPLSRFYIAELTCAVESVHKMGFIHRDIKPDNILIDRDGHIKLTDFGLCTGFRWTHDSKYYQKNGDHSRQDSMEPWEENVEGIKPTVLERRRQRDHQRWLAHSLVGTPNYIAPEVLERSGYTTLCDWWSVGVILYEMLVGQPPFLANTPSETQYKVINWQETLHIPPHAKLTREATDLILKLCCSADRRLGKNADEVKAHPFFKSIDFGKNLRTQKAPYIPKIEHPTDTSNFDPVDPDKLHNSADSVRSDDFMDGTGKPFHGFFEFTFRRFFDDNNPNKQCIESDDQGSVYV